MKGVSFCSNESGLIRAAMGWMRCVCGHRAGESPQPARVVWWVLCRFCLSPALFLKIPVAARESEGFAGCRRPAVCALDENDTIFPGDPRGAPAFANEMTIHARELIVGRRATCQASASGLLTVRLVNGACESAGIGQSDEARCMGYEFNTSDVANWRWCLDRR